MDVSPIMERRPVLSREERKEQRFREREQQILDVARDILLEDGFVGLGMERIAQAIQYSPATVYEHFPCKEEIVLALAIETTELRIRLNGLIRDFNARPREKMMGLAEVSGMLYPRHFCVELIVNTNALQAKTSQEREERLHDLVMVEVAMANEIVEEAIAAGDLALPQGFTVMNLQFALWTLTLGTYGMMRNEPFMAQWQLSDPRRQLREASGLMLDGLGWRPLSSEWDYRKTLKRIYAEVLTPEAIQSVL